MTQALTAPVKYGKEAQSLLNKLRASSVSRENPYMVGIATDSPSFNFTLGNTQLIPQGLGVVLFGPPKSGKSLAQYLLGGWLHKSDPTAIVVKFDTEMRDNFQLTPGVARGYGIDLDRWFAMQRNDAAIFDYIEKDIPAMIDAGINIRMVLIDSINGMMGRRMADAASVTNVQIGDMALTIQEGLKRILAVQRKYKLAIVVTAQVRAEMDAIKQKQGHKDKMAASYALKHWAEYFIRIEAWDAKKGRQDALGRDFQDTTLDGDGRAEQTGHRIKVTCVDSSVGPKGRRGIITLDYQRGLVNQHEETFALGVGQGVITRPTNSQYKIGDRLWKSKESMLEALRTDQALSAEVLGELRRIDIERMERNRDHGESFAHGGGIILDGDEDDGSDIDTANLDLNLEL